MFAGKANKINLGTLGNAVSLKEHKMIKGKAGPDVCLVQVVFYFVEVERVAHSPAWQNEPRFECFRRQRVSK
jgi:hypothetical protein